MTTEHRMSLLEMAADRLDQTVERGAQRVEETSRRGRHSEMPRNEGVVGMNPDQQWVESPCDVTIDFAKLEALGFLTPDTPRNRVSEEMRVIKRVLLDNAFGKNSGLVSRGNIIMVTSSVPGEGKSFTALNLAISIAMEMDKTVLLIDADVGRARIHELLNSPSEPGLTDLLVDRSVDFSDVILRTNIPKLRTIPVGRFHPHAHELLASNNMRALTRQLETRYPDRIVIFDTPPLLSTSDPVVLSGLAGQIVFVVAAGSTPRGVVRDALAMIDESKPVGLVLNKARKPEGSSYYGYGAYGAGYHQDTRN